MVCHQHQMPPLIYQVSFGMGLGAPEQKYRRARSLGNVPNHCVGQCLPPNCPVAVGVALLDRQTGVEQEHATICPGGQTAPGLRKCGFSQTQISPQFFENIAQRGGHWHTGRHRKCKAFGLTTAMVGVLPEDDQTHCLGRGQFQRAQRLRRKNDSASVYAPAEITEQVLPVGRLKKRLHHRLPTERNWPGRGVYHLQLAVGSLLGKQRHALFSQTWLRALHLAATRA